MKSESSSRRRVVRGVRSSHRLFKRGGTHRPIHADDLPYLYAAYKKGIFPVSQGMEPAVFREWISERTGQQMAAGGDFIVVIGETKRGLIPVGICEVNVAKYDNLRPQAIPHMFWFPWASPRNKLEGWVRLLAQLAKGFTVMLIIPPADWRFYNHLCEYRVIRPVGELRHYMADGASAKMYQGNF